MLNKSLIFLYEVAYNFHSLCWLIYIFLTLILISLASVLVSQLPLRLGVCKCPAVINLLTMYTFMFWLSSLLLHYADDVIWIFVPHKTHIVLFLYSLGNLFKRNFPHQVIILSQEEEEVFLQD
jgi:hypothetical protein